MLDRVGLRPSDRRNLFQPTRQFIIATGKMVEKNNPAITQTFL
jgi:hypothetical protein